MTRGIAVRETNFAGNLMTASGAALIGYDYLLTVGRESRFFWKRKMTAASILFFVNRYLALFYYVGLGLGYFRCQSFPLSLVSRCRTQYYIDIATRYLQYLPWAVFSTLRVYALSRKSWFWSAFTFLWSILPIPLDYYVIHCFITRTSVN
ncbi:hypothetical protein LXA43DRAFT_994885 [Ganoderma leucocontextum]|nr:hypothetical protein LXA43DRAFT_994885 [Ganoderma leucocontextum]